MQIDRKGVWVVVVGGSNHLGDRAGRVRRGFQLEHLPLAPQGLYFEIQALEFQHGDTERGSQGTNDNAPAWATQELSQLSFVIAGRGKNRRKSIIQTKFS